MSTNQRKQRRKSVEVERLTKERDDAHTEIAHLRTALRESTLVNAAKAEAYTNMLGQLKHLEVELRAEHEARVMLLDTSTRLANKIAELEALDKDSKKLRRRLAEAKAENAELARKLRNRPTPPPEVIIDGPMLASVAVARARLRRKK